MSEEKSKGGRPLKFSSPEKMEDAVNTYFAECEKREAPFTVMGLCNALDIDRKTLINYEKKDEFFHTIKRAKAKIEQFLEETLYRSGPVTGIIFNLKNNFDWRDEQRVSGVIEAKIGKLTAEDAEKIQGLFDQIVET